MPNEFQRARFSDYELDLRNGTLRNRGTPIRLQRQPFRILELLIQNAGNLVSREELRRTLWPADTHVGFEIGLNRAINRLRNALNDVAATPRFIETVAGRGYRFMAEVEDAAATSREMEPIALGVLPFSNRTGKTELDYLCDGLSEDVHFELARASGLRVMSASTMFQHRESTPDRLRSDLKLDAVVQGEIRERGAQVTLRVELIDCASGALLWGTRIETSLSELQNAKSTIASQVWRTLGIQNAAPKPSRAVSAEAYRLYLQGRFCWNRRTAASMREAISCFEKAIEADPEYAAGYSGIADAYALLGLSPYCALPPKQAMPRAKAAAERALILDPQSAEGHTSLALVQFNYDWDFAAAEESFSRAIELNQSYAAARQWFSLLLIAQGRYAEAREQAALARSLDPMSATANALVGVSLYFAREPRKAQEELRSLLEVEPRSSLAWSFLGMCSIGLKQLDRAEMAFQKALEISPENVTAWAGLGNVWARQGQSERVQAIFQKIDEIEKQRYVPPQVRLFLYLGLGELDKAMNWLERAAEERCDFLVYTDVDPALDPMRGQPRFEKLQTKIGLRKPKKAKSAGPDRD